MTKLRITIVDGKPQAELLDDTGKVTGTADGIELPEGVAIEDVSALRKALSAERKAVKELADRVASFEGIDDPNAARDALEKVRAGGAKTAKEIEEAKKALESKFAADRAKLDQEMTAMESQLSQILLDGAITTAVATNGGKLPLLLPKIKQHAKVERASDGSRRVIVTGDDGKPLVTKASGSADPMGLAEFITSLKGDPEWGTAFNGSGVGGSGTGSTHGGSARAGTSNGTLSPMELLNRANAVPARR